MAPKPWNLFAIVADEGVPVRRIPLAQTVQAEIQSVFDLQNRELFAGSPDEVEFQPEYRPEEDEILFIGDFELPAAAAPLVLAGRWEVEGTHYQRTAEACFSVWKALDRMSDQGLPQREFKNGRRFVTGCGLPPSGVAGCGSRRRRCSSASLRRVEGAAPLAATCASTGESSKRRGPSAPPTAASGSSRTTARILRLAPRSRCRTVALVATFRPLLAYRCADGLEGREEGPWIEEHSCA